MSRGFCLFVVMIGLVGFAAAVYDLDATIPGVADHDAADVLYTAVSDQQGGPQAVLPQRALFTYRGPSGAYPAKPVSPPKKKPCVRSSTPDFFKYRVKLVTKNSVKFYGNIGPEYARYYLNQWPKTYALPEVTPFENQPILLKNQTHTTWGISVRVYLKPLNLERCPTSAAEARYKAHIAEQAKSKVTGFKSPKVVQIGMF